MVKVLNEVFTKKQWSWWDKLTLEKKLAYEESYTRYLENITRIKTNELLQARKRTE